LLLLLLLLLLLQPAAVVSDVVTRLKALPATTSTPSTRRR